VRLGAARRQIARRLLVLFDRNQRLAARLRACSVASLAGLLASA
jgi:hypothetical protein